MKLATVQKIVDIQPIPGADSIEVATVLGWQVVIKKGEYKIGDLCVYIQIDTIVPDKPEFEFLRERKFRVRTIKLRKQISQGLIIPISTSWKGGLSEGDDVTGYVGAKKYEKDPPQVRYEKPRMPKKWYKKIWYIFKFNYLYKWFPSLCPKQRSPFPTKLISITDEERVQNIPIQLANYIGKFFSISHKLDGSSITIIHHKGKFRICSRRFELHDKNNEWYKVFESANFSKHILALVRFFNTGDIIVQGEAIGSFNGNHHNLKENEIRLFNIQVDGKRLLPNDFFFVCEALQIPHCPQYKTLVLDYTMEEILKISEIKDVLNPEVEAEGLVWRCVDDGFSFKVINNKYLLKHE